MPSHPALNQTDHRPWERPRHPWRWEQSWQDLLFVHWEIEVRYLRRFVPDELEIDTYSGTAWLGIVPFRMEGLSPRGFPRPQRLCDFPQINVRTYVKHQGKPGVWFLSIDIPKRFSAWLARNISYLPYQYASMRMEVDSQETVHFRSQHPDRVFQASYSQSKPCHPSQNSFEHWATERYCLYAEDFNQRLHRTEIQHPKWPLRTATADIECNSYLAEFPVGQQHPSILYATQLPVVAWQAVRL